MGFLSKLIFKPIVDKVGSLGAIFLSIVAGVLLLILAFNFSTISERFGFETRASLKARVAALEEQNKELLNANKELNATVEQIKADSKKAQDAISRVCEQDIVLQDKKDFAISELKDIQRRAITKSKKAANSAKSQSIDNDPERAQKYIEDSVAHRMNYIDISFLESVQVVYRATSQFFSEEDLKHLKLEIQENSSIVEKELKEKLEEEKQIEERLQIKSSIEVNIEEGVHHEG